MCIRDRFSTIESLNKSYPDFIISFDIEENENLDSLLEIKGNNKLLEIAMSNVLKNACVYSDNKQAKVKIFSNGLQLLFEISNSGKTLTENEQKNLFQPFMRGENSKGTTGFGLGLRIVQRILTLHKATINYQIQDNDTNVFVVCFHG